MEEIEVRQCLLFIALHELRRLLNQVERLPLHVGGEPGCEWIHRLLTGHPGLCKEQLRLDKNTFVKLACVLRKKQLLTDGRFIHVEEQLAIGLYIMAKADSYRDAADRFQHGISTISIYFKAVLKALVTLASEVIRPYQSLNEIPPEIENNALYWPFFKVQYTCNS